jgi:hypothetical protein
MTTPLTDAEIAEMERLERRVIEAYDAHVNNNRSRGAWEFEQEEFDHAIAKHGSALLRAAREANGLRAQVETLRDAVRECADTFQTLRTTGLELGENVEVEAMMQRMCEVILSATSPLATEAELHLRTTEMSTGPGGVPVITKKGY